MASDPEVLAAVSAAVQAAPESVPLRLHLAGLLLEADRGREALDHVQLALTRKPADPEALRLAAACADAAGEATQADGYRSLLTALGAPAASTVEEERPGSRPVAATSDESEDLLGAELEKYLLEVVGNGEDPDLERPVITLEDVGGLVEVKRRLQVSFLGPMRNPELRRQYGKSLRGGFLMYGPPGCGKTFLARAVAGELGARFFSVGLHDVLDMWLGNSEKNVHAIFETARRSTPCVLFLDEVDALGMKRSNLAHSAGRNVVVQLLSEMESTKDNNEGVFVLGATNQPWDLDPALRRPGRFDRMLLVLPPDEPAREVILSSQLASRPTEQIDSLRYAQRTEGYSGADLRLVCEAATEFALEDSISTGQVRPVGPKDMDRALKEVRPSTRPWFEMAKNFAMFANESGTYDDLLAYMRTHRLG